MNADKEHKIEDESRAFNKEWTIKYYFTKVGNKAGCLLCHAATEASFMVSYKLAKRNKPFSDCEFIKEWISDVANIMCLEQKTKIGSIALSVRTVIRCVEKISDDLMSQLQGMDANFQLTEGLLSVESLKELTTSKDLFRAVESCIARPGLEWNKIASVTTDGAFALTRENAGLLKLRNDKIKSEHPGHALIPLHCVIECMCKGAPNINQVTDSIVNLIRARGLNHRQFRELLANLETEHLDVFYHNHVRWLSLGRVLRRVGELREEIVMFLEMKKD
ncbi:unnamed protein product [Lepeophtheirus salmonis]|uniref:(salmon louse) hypothetical protein n=1 Tax=Lepeophtheirus salmonis TaxID=72036 RepID=A0A7R8CTI5_LEPSM|nr:unnamed protein product [Lepeophtheirus salmonis]CAF2874162.1 unnamed protein product [Lepeophtheirus salmonis]